MTLTVTCPTDLLCLLETQPKLVDSITQDPMSDVMEAKLLRASHPSFLCRPFILTPSVQFLYAADGSQGSTVFHIFN